MLRALLNSVGERLRDGELLRTAEEFGFEVIVTADRNLKHQQNLKERSIAVVVLPSGRWPIVKLQLPEVVSAVNAATPGSYREIIRR